MPNFAYPGQTDAHIATMEASGRLVVDFARNQNDFAVNKYAQIVPVTKSTGIYMVMNVDMAGKVENVDLNDLAWPDGNDSPDAIENLEGFLFQQFWTRRRNFPFRIGRLTKENADWDIFNQNSAKQAQRAMTARTQLAINALTDATQYPANHVVTDVTTIPGVRGKWSISTTARQDIKRSIEYAVEIIRDDTLDAVKIVNLQLVMNSYTAAALTQTQELVDFIKSSPVALQQIRGELPGGSADYDLPERLYKLEVVVESTRKTTNKRGATKAVSQVLPNGTVLITARPGGLVGVANAPSFSTCTIFALEEMTVESKEDEWNRVTKGRVVEDTAAVVTAPAAGFLFENVV